MLPFKFCKNKDHRIPCTKLSSVERTHWEIYKNPSCTRESSLSNQKIKGEPHISQTLPKFAAFQSSENRLIYSKMRKFLSKVFGKNEGTKEKKKKEEVKSKESKSKDKRQRTVTIQAIPSELEKHEIKEPLGNVTKASELEDRRVTHTRSEDFTGM